MSIEITNESLMQKEYSQQPKIIWNELFVPKIEKKREAMLRPVIDFKDPRYLRIVRHKYLKGVGSTICVNTAETIKNGGFCPFCDYVRVNLNRIYDIIQPLIDITVDKEGKRVIYTIKTPKELEAAIADIIKNQYSGWEKIKELSAEADRIDMLKAGPEFVLPVIDRSSPGKIKLYEHTVSVKKGIEAIAKNRNITTADLRIENQNQAPLWYAVTREDPADFTDKEKELIAKELPELEKTMDTLYGKKASSFETATARFAKFSESISGVKSSTSPQGVNSDLSASNFTVQPQ